MASAQDKLVIFKGDDTGGSFGRRLAFVIEAGEGTDLTGCRAEWIFDGIVKEFAAPLVAGETREVFYSHNETAQMRLGVRYGSFRIIDAAGKVRTFTNTKAVEVTNDVKRCYPSASSATIHIGSDIGDMKHSEFADLETKDGMTLKEVGAMVNRIVGKLKGGAAAVAFALMFGGAAFAQLTPQTEFGDVPPSATIREVVEKSGAASNVDGAARPLPKYLHALSYDATYPEDVAALRGLLVGRFGCSARRNGNTFERNYDLHLDETAEFVVRMSAVGSRFASLGVANVGTNLTEQFVTSGKPSRWYKVLPSIMLDGINENGVVCEVNVTDGEWGRTSGELHCLEAVRWALDNGTSAGMVASNLAAKVYIPQGFGNFHWMVADENETWIVENREAIKVTDAVAVMTNFNIGSAGGEGHERYASLVGGAAITSQWWTAAYDRTTRPIRVSDIGANYEAVWAAWESATKEEHRAQWGWWQTLHTSVYDITNRVLRVAVQEQDDWYVFALSGKPVETDPTVPSWAKSPTPPEGMTANALVWTNSAVKTKDGGKTIGATDVGALTFGQVYSLLAPITLQVNEHESRIAVNESDITAIKPYAYNALQKTGGEMTGTIYMTTSNNEAPIQIVGGSTSSMNGLIDVGIGFLGMKNNRIGFCDAYGGWEFYPFAYTSDITAAIDHTSPRFSNEVLSVGFSFATNEVTSATYIAATNVLAQLGLDEEAMASIPGGGVYGSIGALLAALAAAVALLRKRTQLLDNDGKATDQFATDFLSKDVAKEAIRNLGLQYDATTDEWYIETEEA